MTEQDENTLNEIFSLRLSRVLAEKSMTQRQLSVLTNIAQSAISKYMAGKGLPRTAELYKLAKVLGVSMDHLCGLKDNKPIHNDLYTENISLKSSLRFAIGTLEGALGTLRQQLPNNAPYRPLLENDADQCRVAESSNHYES